MDWGAFAKVGAESALIAQPGQLPGPGPGMTNQSPLTMLPATVPTSWSKKVPCRPPDIGGDPLDAHEAGR